MGPWELCQMAGGRVGRELARKSGSEPSRHCAGPISHCTEASSLTKHLPSECGQIHSVREGACVRSSTKCADVSAWLLCDKSARALAPACTCLCVR
eukprot:2438948-Pleurochrysis_carterae.AAC.1